MKRGLSEFDLAAAAGGEGALVADVDVDNVDVDDPMGVPEPPKAAASRHKARRRTGVCSQPGG